MSSKNASSARKGDAVEQLVAATCVLATGRELDALTELVGDERVDVVFKRRNRTRLLDVQVTSSPPTGQGARAHIAVTSTPAASCRGRSCRVPTQTHGMSGTGIFGR
jgi:hypothetical protein